MKTELTTWVDMELRLRFNKSSGYEVEPINSWEFNVKYAGIGSFWKTSVVELCYHQIVGDQQEDQEKREFVQVERLRAHDAVVDVVIMGIIEKTCK
ncbi:hypothetical protein CK203_028198 [Vitis vinifera]|uniref:Uncharacterized protein n=1 Tax=Vitis vinifera TaxID=29760 RepID=A0A438IAU6_VITVI|nr:hypothetical protein CK203_028198 [Vitis vinifera]